MPMIDLEFVVHLLSRRYYVEAACLGILSAAKHPTALAHMLAGAACCGCAEPLAYSQRLLEDAPIADSMSSGGLLVSPASSLPYDGFFHLIEALRLDPSIQAPHALHEVFHAIALELSFVSRREIHQPPNQRRMYTGRLASAGGAILLNRLAGGDGRVPGLSEPLLASATGAIEIELRRTGGDAAFFEERTSAP